MIIALSVAFLPVVYANCWIGWIACLLAASFQPRRFGVVQSPYTRLTEATPNFAISATRASLPAGWALSASMRTASLASGVSGMAATLRRAPLLDDDLHPLELLELGVAGGGHRPAQCTDQVHGAVGDPRGPEQDLLERADGLELDALAARQLGVVRLGTPVEAPAGCVGGAGERRADHHRVRTAGDRLGDVTGAADRPVGDDVDVAAAGLVHVVA